MFACVLYVCLCIVCLQCDDWVCTQFRNYEMAAIGFVLSKPDAVLFDWVSTLYKFTVCGDCMFACVLYVCLCVVCLLCCLCDDWVCTQFRNYEIAAIGFVLSKPDAVCIRLGLYSVQILHYAVIVCLLVYCMFACVL